MESMSSTPVLNRIRRAVKRSWLLLPAFVLATAGWFGAQASTNTNANINATSACPVPNAKRPQAPLDDDEPLVDPGRSLALRLLALLGAASFVMLGVSSVVVPLMQPPEPSPMPDQRQRSAA
jgi:hypothetical protein